MTGNPAPDGDPRVLVQLPSGKRAWVPTGQIQTAGGATIVGSAGNRWSDIARIRLPGNRACRSAIGQEKA